MLKCKIDQISKAYGDKLALDHISLDVNEHEVLCILGPSGCGKSTLLKIIAGLLKQDTGKIEIDGEVVSSFEDKIHKDVEDREIGFVFQNYALWPFMSVYDNVAYPLKVRKLDQKTIDLKVKEMLELVRLEDKIQAFPEELSGGEQQRVALARALVYKPSLLLLDEPLSNLDASLRVLMQQELVRIQKEMDITMIHVTHDQEEAMAIADRIAIMDHGKLMQCGRKETIYKNPRNAFVANFVGKANIVKANVENKMLYVFEKPYKEVDELDGVVQVAIKREDIHINTSGKGMYQGVINQLEYKGQYNDLILDVNGVMLRVQDFYKLDLKQGEKASFDLLHVAILEE